MTAPHRRRTRGWLLAIALLAAAAPAAAHTPTQTFGPSPTPTATGTLPPPRPVFTARPNPARSGQQVLLDGTASQVYGNYGYDWSQSAGEVAIDIAAADQAIASFVVPPLDAPTSVAVQLSIRNPSGFVDPNGPCQSIDLLPAHTVRLEVGNVGAVPGSSVDVDVVLRPVGLAVTSVRNELTFDPLAAVAARDGQPDCRLGPELTGSASFTFGPDGCTPQVDCDRVRASVLSDAPIPDRVVVYTCTVGVDGTTSATSCERVLGCTGAEAATPEGSPLDVDCRDGAVQADYAAAPLQFTFSADPAEPMVGDTVHLTFFSSGDGGLPSYTLAGAYPYLTVTAQPTPGGGLLGTAVFEARAECPGVAQLQLSVYYETTAGCPGNTYFYFRNAVSAPFPLTIREPGSYIVSGRVAEFPDGCQGGMRGVTVRLDPLGWTTQTDLVGGNFSFGDVPPGDYTLMVLQGCNPFGCWDPQPVHVQDADVQLTICPQRIGPGGCSGDCNDDGRVTVAELVTSVSIALGIDDVPACAAIDADGDGTVTIAELITGVVRAVRGCPGT
jgi:hypothetical protein